MKKNKYFITLIFVLFINHSFSSEKTKGSSFDYTSHGETSQIKLYIDSTRSLKIEELEKIQNKAIPIKSKYIIPSTEFDYWFIIKFKNNDNKKTLRHIGFDISCLEIVDLYYKDSSGWVHKKNGLIIPLDKREVYSRLPGYEISFGPFEEKTLYIHMHSSYLVPVKIINESVSTYYKSESKSLFAHWMYFGAAIAILLFNLLLYIQLKDKVYLFYIIYVFFLLIWVSLDSGLFLYINSNINTYYFLSIGAPTMGAFLTLFTREILKIRKHSKWMDITLMAIAIVYFLIAILVGINVYFYQFLGIIAMPFSLFLLFVGIYGVLKKIPLSYFYLTASSFYIVGLFLYAGLTIEAVPYTSLSRYGFILGSFFELIVFSLALGYRIKLLQAEKLSYQKKMIDSERAMSKKLELKVKERTHELTIASEKLEQTNKLLSEQIDIKNEAIDEIQKSDKKLKESNRAKDKLFTIISHDLIGPLGSIMNLLQLIKDNFDHHSMEQRKKYINSLYKTTSSTYRLLENLLFWSRNQSDGIVLKPENIKLSQIISEIVGVLKTQAESKNISLKIPETITDIVGDEEMIKTIIRNLISNAIKFTEAGGHISLSITTSLTPRKETIIAVTDSGLGISEERIKDIFNPGNDSSTFGTNNEKGTGLGLALCKEFVKKHQGDIWVESEPGKGSTFSFSIPWMNSTTN